MNRSHALGAVAAEPRRRVAGLAVAVGPAAVESVTALLRADAAFETNLYVGRHEGRLQVGVPVADAAVGQAGGPPGLYRTRLGPVMLALDGQLSNAELLREELEERGALFSSDAHAELLLHLLAVSDQKTLVNRVVDALLRVEGGVAAAILTGDHLLLARDPWGLRPLLLGRHLGGWIVGSDWGKLARIGAEVLREVDPGELLIIDPDRVESLRPLPRRQRQSCALELLDLACPTALVAGHEARAARVRAGEILARELPVRADVVVPMPPQGEAAALGFARVLGVPFDPALLSGTPPAVVRSAVYGQRVVVVDSLLLVGQELAAAVRAIRAAGAAEVHVRIAAPAAVDACRFGVDLGDRNELTGVRYDPARARAWLDADSLGWMSPEGLRELLGSEAARSCVGCLTGHFVLEQRARRGAAQLPLFSARSG